jgi:hypothetical protein
MLVGSVHATAVSSVSIDENMQNKFSQIEDVCLTKNLVLQSTWL